jgi:hypothetical protein
LTATLTPSPLSNACTRLDPADGRKLLVDYADMRNRTIRGTRASICQPNSGRTGALQKSCIPMTIIAASPANCFGWHTSSSTRAKAASRFGSCGFRDGELEPVREPRNGPLIPLVCIADMVA